MLRVLLLWFGALSVLREVATESLTMDFSSLAIHSNPDAYWCADGHRFTFDCSHLVEPLDAPAVKLNHFQVKEVRWAKNVLQIRMNTGEGRQYFGVPRWVAVAVVKNPNLEVNLCKSYRFQRVRGRVPV